MQDETDAETGRANEGWADWRPLHKLEASGGKDECRIEVRHSKGAVNIAGLEGEGNGLGGIGMDRAEVIVSEDNFVGSSKGEVVVERESCLCILTCRLVLACGCSDDLVPHAAPWGTLQCSWF
ncbi:hypothetical protein BC827DRAFT_1152211 [Russula dissimulans]|nr:hypothetical protein BC827DRAFT_1152211 [Russula dissimulans]